MSRPHQFIMTRSKYIEPNGESLNYYAVWVQEESEYTPGFQVELFNAAKELLDHPEELVQRSAIQAIACTALPVQIDVFKSKSNIDHLTIEIEEAIKFIKFRSKTLEELLDEVVDLNTFIIFARSLADERDKAAEIEKENPKRYCVDGALGWKNADISSYIYAGLIHFERLNPSSQPTWEDIALFLFMGKIYE